MSATLAGMNMSPVSRLKKTWGKAKTAKFFILEVQLTNMEQYVLGRIWRKHFTCLLNYNLMVAELPDLALFLGLVIKKCSSYD